MEPIALNIGQPVVGVVATLFAILVAVLVLPLVSRKVEENLEPFFLLMGIIAVVTIYLAGILPGSEVPKLTKSALLAPLMIHGIPIGIAEVVLIAGLAFYYYHRPIYRGIGKLLTRLGLRGFIFIIVLILGLTSSIISVIVAAVIYSEIMAALPLTRSKKIEVTVLAAFALGMGAALTPLGEPLATIAVHKLAGPPYHAGFDFLIRTLGDLIIPGVVAVSLYTAIRAGKGLSEKISTELFEKLEYGETLRNVVMRAVRVYIFVAALELLGTGFTPLVEWYFSKIPPYILYWVNMISAVVDNATLTAAEIGPYLTIDQIRAALIGLLISGGMLIPGNIPNIVAAARLRITSKEWARIGVPFGLVLLTIYFVALAAMGTF
jgi:predicted cation transporter